MNMPDWSSRRGLGTSAFTVIVRPGKLHHRIDEVHPPGELARPGSAATRKVTCCPTFSWSA